MPSTNKYKGKRHRHIKSRSGHVLIPFLAFLQPFSDHFTHGLAQRIARLFYLLEHGFHSDEGASQELHQIVAPLVQYTMQIIDVP